MGRPASFDPQQLLGEVTELFWKQGYFATSVADLGELTGLNPGSIYNAFGNKRGVLVASLDHYGRNSIERARTALRGSDSIDQGIGNFFDLMIAAILEDKDAKGCFLVNTWLETAAHDEEIKAHIQTIFNAVEEEFLSAFKRAQKRGEIAKDADLQVLSQYMMMTIWGLRVKGRMMPNRRDLQAMVQQAMTAVRQVMLKDDSDHTLRLV
ncbi:MAG: TetR/AcrR family transcriptional regulator [Motiliproteus sp.]|nr:TetR/AcrR family transcriptional regulator [Motiliproteus sp.]MCW9052458.1 TetR/AcrR family transcriptional regulator [Motiliproteus sp.]